MTSVKLGSGCLYYCKVSSSFLLGCNPVQWMVYHYVSGVWVGHHFQLWEGLLHPGRIPDGRRSSRNVQNSCGSIDGGGRHSPRGALKYSIEVVGFSCCSWNMSMCPCSHRRQWRNTWASLPTEPGEGEGASHLQAPSKRFITVQHFYLVTNNDSFDTMLWSWIITCLVIFLVWFEQL